MKNCEQCKRCVWANGNDMLMQAYHDNEYGRKMNNDAELFEKLCLECFQAGLSWRTILYKRDALREAFLGFEPALIARMDAGDVDALMKNSGIIRNKKKIEAVIHNARLHKAQFPDDGDFVRYVYGFSEGAALCADLKKRGYRFIGQTMCVSFLLSVGAVKAHESQCFLHIK
ncbi:MAG: DNA-3-methyladenine glycosylase I [Christensenellales bacterium]